MGFCPSDIILTNILDSVLIKCKTATAKVQGGLAPVTDVDKASVCAKLSKFPRGCQHLNMSADEIFTLQLHFCGCFHSDM